MLDLPEDWVWDFWVVDDPDSDPVVGTASYHLFFLKAPRSLGDPELRHRNASVGHAVSTDLRHWTRVADALAPQASPSFDDLATWTGCVVRGDDGVWRMFSTGLSRAEDGRVQRIGVSTSEDLLTWRRNPEPVLVADGRWYTTFRPGVAGLEEAWRDPWVVRDDAGRWHLYATAHVVGGTGAAVAHAVSEDLATWEVRPPLSAPSSRFGWAEVISVVEVDGRWALLFSCLSDQMPHDEPGSGGIWSVAVDGPGAPVDLSCAVRLTSEDLYVGKVVPLRGGGHRFLAFANRDEEGRFPGGVIDPCEVAWNDDGTALRLVGDVPVRWLP
jgi:beta-fructofuranosidase